MLENEKNPLTEMKQVINLFIMTEGKVFLCRYINGDSEVLNGVLLEYPEDNDIPAAILKKYSSLYKCGVIKNIVTTVDEEVIRDNWFMEIKDTDIDAEANSEDFPNSQWYYIPLIHTEKNTHPTAKWLIPLCKDPNILLPLGSMGEVDDKDLEDARKESAMMYHSKAVNSEKRGKYKDLMENVYKSLKADEKQVFEISSFDISLGFGITEENMIQEFKKQGIRSFLVENSDRDVLCIAGVSRQACDTYCDNHKYTSYGDE